MNTSIKRLLKWAVITPLIVVLLLWAYSSVPIKASWAEFGYYGHFNQVQRIIRSMPELRIVDSFQHHDVIMEDFSFIVDRQDGTRVQICFWEGTPQMKLRRDREIQDFIETTVSEKIKKNPAS